MCVLGRTSSQNCQIYLGLLTFSAVKLLSCNRAIVLDYAESAFTHLRFVSFSYQTPKWRFVSEASTLSLCIFRLVAISLFKPEPGT